MPWYSYKCECGHSYDKIEFGSEINEDHICLKCSKIMEREFCPSGNFILKYDSQKDSVSWGSEGYKTSQKVTEKDKK
jgi:hypothetical protein